MKIKKSTAIVMAVGMGTFMASLDTSVVNLVIPLIKEDFGVSLSMIEWIVTAYLLVISSLLLTYGRISDLYGHKKIYSTGYIVFLIGSILCGFSFNIVTLIICRIIQALGAGMLFSTGAAIITDAVPPTSRGKALSVSAIAMALGLCIGPVIGGTLSSLFDWQSIFFINIPIGILGLIMIFKNIPPDEKKESAPFDIVGSIMVFIALFLILTPLNISGDYDIPHIVFVLLVASGIIVMFLFITYESKCKHPMLNIKLFHNRIFTASVIAAFFTYLAQFIMVFIAPFYLESLRMFSPLVSGLLYLPMPIATICIAPLSGSFSDRFDSRFLSSAGNLIMAAGLLMLSFYNIDTSYLYIIVSMIVMGIGFGMFQTPNNSSIMGNVPPENRGTAAGTLGTMRNIGMALGVATSGALFSFYQNKGITKYSSQGLSGSILQSSSFIYALHLTFLASAIVSLVAMIASLSKGRLNIVKNEVK